MHHAFIDIYADLNTPIHKLNPKSKIIFLFGLLVLIIFSPIKFIPLFLFYGSLVTVLIYLSKIPVQFVLKRLMEILPFVILITLSVLFQKQGYILFLSCLIKSVLAVMLTLIVSSTTKFVQLLEALRQLKFPRIFIKLLSFMYRYSFLLEDQLLRARRAYASRNINPKNNLPRVRILGNILGSVLIRTYERAERIYLAMCARGYGHEKGY